VARLHASRLDLDDIQGDALLGMPKNAEQFLFFKIVDPGRFKAQLRQHVVGLLTNSRRVLERNRLVADRRWRGEPARESWLGANLGFTKDGITRLLGPRRPALEPAFERGAGDPQTLARLNDPPPARWVAGFRSDRIDGVFLIAGPNRAFAAYYDNELRTRLGGAIKVVHSEMGTVRPGPYRGYEHFGFRDGISQPGIRGLDPVSRPSASPDQGLPGQDLLWPGEFVLGYPEQDARDPEKPGPVAPLPAPWAKNGSYMVFRRLEQRVPEFHAFVAAEAARLAISPELLAARMLGRWKSGAPLELAPLEDKPWLGGDAMRNNDFGYAGDPFQRACPYAAHIRKANPRDDVPGERAEMLRHRIIRQSISFGPEVMPGETRTAHSRGLLFVCYQASIERQFEYIQGPHANNPDFVSGKARPDSGVPVVPGFDPIIGQAPGSGPRAMDEPAPNWPAGNRHSRLDMPQQFVVLTGAAYFFMPSLSALRTVLT
jgi:Dyp-type peroxidase family